MIYVLHFDTPYKHAEHYLGYTEHLNRRLWLHAHGYSNVKLLRAARAAGTTWHVAAVYEGDRYLERRLHRRGAKRCCELCNPGFDIAAFKAREQCGRANTIQ